MRIHRLQISAFGPFAARESVDFDALGEQGLFLLNGATGAGKTSVLDAVCFALYGKVPGSRSDLKRLRSDHAAVDAEPEVICEFSTGGRRFEVTRSPAWERLRKRGTGTTTAQAQTKLREKTSAGWEVKSTRNDEASVEIAAVLGMTMDQFTKVVLLAQGDFAAFLRAKADERGELLQKLFGTAIYAQVEEQLGAQARAAATEVNASTAQLEQLRSTASHAASSVLEPATLAESTAADAAEYFEQLLQALRTAVEHQHAQHQQAQAAAESSQSALTTAEEVRVRAQKLAAALAAMERVRIQDPAQQERVAQLSAHRDAAVLRSVVETADDSMAAAAAAADAHSAAASALAESAPTLRLAGLAGLAPASPVLDVNEPTDRWTVDELDAARTLLEHGVAEVESAMPREAELKSLTAEVGKLEQDQASRQLAIEQIGNQLEDLRSQHAQAVALAAELGTVASTLALKKAQFQRAQAVYKASRDYGVAVAEVSSCEAAVAAATATALTAKEAWLAQREHRLNLAIGELAAALVDGEPCTVCGSLDHPQPSDLRVDGARGVADEDAAKVAFDQADAARASSEKALAAAQSVVAGLAAIGGDVDADSAAAAEAAAHQALQEAAEASESLDAATASVSTREAEVAALEEQRVKHQTALIQLKATHQNVQQNMAALATSLETVREEFETLEGKAGALQRGLKLVTGASNTLGALSIAHAVVDAAAQKLTAALAGSSFGDAAAVHAALLPEPSLARISEAIRAHDELAVRAEAGMEDPDVLRAQRESESGLDIPDSEAVEEFKVRLAEALALAQSARDDALAGARSLREVADLQSRFTFVTAAAAPLHQRATMLAGLAESARGQGENSYKMALSSYVLAARLEQVADAASLRLVAMSDGRYTLAHSDAKAARGMRSGLGLDVVDEWTGLRRDTSTLSGGESFMASLALALGLADVVQQEAGGLDIETLFVDEGFGSLDEQSLEQVMDALEGLRSGGRVVGLVSHVAEMKQRIPVQLCVSKGRNGSTLKIVNTGLDNV